MCILFIKLWAAEGDVTEKPIDPVKVYSDKELIREIEKIASILVPEKDWSVRIAAMQRIEGLVLGGWCFKIPFQDSVLIVICL
jgi:CLIP-associating protein 1/2